MSIGGFMAMFGMMILISVGKWMGSSDDHIRRMMEMDLRQIFFMRNLAISGMGFFTIGVILLAGTTFIFN